MSWLTEDPSPLLYLTIAVQLVLLVALMQTRRVAVIGIMAVVLAMLGVVYLVDTLVVTQREEVAEVLDEMVAATVAGDKDQLLDHVALEAKALRNRVNLLFKSGKVEKADIIAGPNIVLNDLTIPPSATVQFKVHAQIQTSLYSGPYTGEITVQFDRVDGRWLAAQSEDNVPR